jgi:transposase InsO family protein
MVAIPRMAKFLDPLQGSYRITQYSMLGNPQQNGVAERCNRILMDMMKSMLSYSTLLISL